MILLKLETEKSLAQYSDFEINHLSFLLGPCIFNTNIQIFPSLLIGLIKRLLKVEL